MVKIIKILKVVSTSAQRTDAHVFSEASLTALSNSFNYDKCGVKKITAAAFYSWLHGYVSRRQKLYADVVFKNRYSC